MIRPREFEVDNGEGIKPDIRIDPESLREGELFFEIDQDSETIIVNLDCLRGLVAAAEELAKTRETRAKKCGCGEPEAPGVVHRTDGPCYMEEPVAWGVPNTRLTEKQPFMQLLHSTDGCQYPELLVPLYTRPSKPLTAPQVHELDWPEGVAFEDVLAFVRAIEKAHGIGGQDGQG